MLHERLRARRREDPRAGLGSRDREKRALAQSWDDTGDQHGDVHGREGTEEGDGSHGLTG